MLSGPSLRRPSPPGVNPRLGVLRELALGTCFRRRVGVRPVSESWSTERRAAQQQCKARLYGACWLLGAGQWGMRGLATLLIAIAVSAPLGGCSPALDWREMSPAGSGPAIAHPLQGALQARAASATGPAMGMAVCEAAGYRFSLAWADLDGPRAPRLPWKRCRGPWPLLASRLDRWRRWPFRRDADATVGELPLLPWLRGSGTRIAVFAKGPAGLPVDTPRCAGRHGGVAHFRRRPASHTPDNLRPWQDCW